MERSPEMQKFVNGMQKTLFGRDSSKGNKND